MKLIYFLDEVYYKKNMYINVNNITNYINKFINYNL